MSISIFLALFLRSLIAYGALWSGQAHADGVLLWQGLRAGMTQKQATSALKEPVRCEYSKQFRETECKTVPFLDLAGERAYLKLYFPSDGKLKWVRLWVSIDHECKSLFMDAGMPLTTYEKKERERVIAICERPLFTRFRAFDKQAQELYTRKYGQPRDLYGSPVWYSQGREIQLQHMSAGEFGIMYRQDKALGQI